MTARDYAQTLELLQLHGIAHRRRRAGPRRRGRVGKARALARRLPRAAPLGQGRSVRRRARPRLARADAGGAPPPDPERHRARLRVRDAPAPARAPRGDTRRLPGGDPARAPGASRRAAAEARPLPGDQGGVLPRRLRARPGRRRAASTPPRCSRRAARRRRSPSTTGTGTRSSADVLERLGRDESVHAVVLPRTRGAACSAIRVARAPVAARPERAVDAQSLSRSPTSSSRPVGR